MKTLLIIIRISWDFNFRLTVCNAGQSIYLIVNYIQVQKITIIITYLVEGNRAGPLKWLDQIKKIAGSKR